MHTQHMFIYNALGHLWTHTHTYTGVLPPRTARTGTSLISLTCLFSSRLDLSATERKHKLDPSASKLVFLQEPHPSPIHVHARTMSVHPRTKSVHSQTGLALKSAAKTPCWRQLTIHCFTEWHRLRPGAVMVWTSKAEGGP